jgi:hypothetical protein
VNVDRFLAWLLTSMPCIIYLGFTVSYFLRGQARRGHVDTLLETAPLRGSYAKAHQAGENAGALKTLPSPKEHVIPLLLWCLVVFPVSVAAAIAAELPLGLPAGITDNVHKLPVNVLAGFAGGYIWGLWACIERFRVANWTASFVHGLWVRMLLGGMLGALITVPWGTTYTPLLAFSMGAFPVATLRKWLRRRAAKIVGMTDDENAAGPEWSTIQGITPELLDRLEEADIASPTALANADPFQLFLRTNITWRHVLDLIDQSILACYVGTKIELVRARGIRGSIEMGLLGERMSALPPENPNRKAAEASVVQISAALGQEREATLTLIENLAEDAQVDLIWKLWFDGPAKGEIYRGAIPFEQRPPTQQAVG